MNLLRRKKRGLYQYTAILIETLMDNLRGSTIIRKIYVKNAIMVRVALWAIVHTLERTAIVQRIIIWSKEFTARCGLFIIMEADLIKIKPRRHRAPQLLAVKRLSGYYQ
jgi:hypothetical protein